MSVSFKNGLHKALNRLYREQQIQKYQAPRFSPDAQEIVNCCSKNRLPIINEEVERVAKPILRPAIGNQEEIPEMLLTPMNSKACSKIPPNRSWVITDHFIPIRSLSSAYAVLHPTVSPASAFHSQASGLAAPLDEEQYWSAIPDINRVPTPVSPVFFNQF